MAKPAGDPYTLGYRAARQECREDFERTLAALRWVLGEREALGY